MAAKHQQTYTMNAGMQAICTVIRSADFASRLRTEIKSENTTDTGVWFRIHHGASFTSWGEKITITLSPLSENSTQVTILSECGMPTQVIDWGKNKQVVCNVYEYLQTNVKNVPAQEAPAPQQPVRETPAAQAGGFCSQCGAPVSQEAKFCSKCGAKLV